MYVRPNSVLSLYFFCLLFADSTERQAERQTKRRTDRQRDRQIDELTDRQTDGRIDRQTDRQIGRQTGRYNKGALGFLVLDIEILFKTAYVPPKMFLRSGVQDLIDSSTGQQRFNSDRRMNNYSVTQWWVYSLFLFRLKESS